MKIRFFAALLASAIGLPLGAAEIGIELSGILTTGGNTRLALTDTEKNVTTWVQPGDEFKGFVVARFDPQGEAVFLRKGAQETRLGLVSPKTLDATSSPPPAVGTATPAANQAIAIQSNLRQLAAAARQYQARHNVTTVGYNDLVGPDKLIRELKPVAGEDYSTLNFGPNVTGVNVTTQDGMTISLDLNPGAVAPVSARAHQAGPAPTDPAANPPPAARPAPPANVSIQVLTPTGRQPASPSYTIQGGDTWQKISDTTGVSVGQLKQLNPAILEGSALPAGQTIRIR